MISVDKGACMAFGYCWNNCSSVFMEDTDGKAKVIPGMENSDAPCVAESQENCCPGAINIT